MRQFLTKKTERRRSSPRRSERKRTSVTSSADKPYPPGRDLQTASGWAAGSRLQPARRTACWPPSLSLSGQARKPHAGNADCIYSKPCCLEAPGSPPRGGSRSWRWGCRQPPGPSPRLMTHSHRSPSDLCLRKLTRRYTIDAWSF